MPKRKRRRRVPKAQQVAWLRNHDAQNQLRKAAAEWQRRRSRALAAERHLRKVIAECYELGASPDYIADVLGRTSQAVRKTWLPPPT